MKTRLFFFFLGFTLFACSFFSRPGSLPLSTPPDILTVPKPTEPEIVPAPSWQDVLLDSAGDEITPAQSAPRPTFPPPLVQPSIPLPSLADVLPVPAGTVNLLLLGSDERSPFDGVRTDTILFVSFHPKGETVSIISFPRDLYVYIPGWTVRRINEAYQHGGFELLADTFDYNFGLRPEYYLLVNFEAFQQAVDSLGGIDVQVGEALAEGDYEVHPGLVHMDGEMALWYVRSRYTTSDFERMTRQQEVLMAIFQRLISVDALKKIPQMYTLYEESVQTNISLQNTLAWSNVAKHIADDPANLQTLTLGREYVTPFRTPAGAQVLLPERALILAALREMLIK
ncbi:MAG: LCP family protein [Anaerolineales bacterium]